MKQEDVKKGAIVGYRHKGQIARRGEIVFVGTDYVRVRYDAWELSGDVLVKATNYETVETDHKPLLFPWVDDPERTERVMIMRRDREQRIKENAEIAKAFGQPPAKVKNGDRVYRDSLRLEHDEALVLARRLNRRRR